MSRRKADLSRNSSFHHGVRENILRMISYHSGTAI
jgi:hypothetical protein